MFRAIGTEHRPVDHREKSGTLAIVDGPTKPDDPDGPTPPPNEATSRTLLSAIDALRDPTHALSGLATLAAEQAQGSVVAPIVGDVEREVRRITASIEAVIEAAENHRRASGLGSNANLPRGADVLVVDDNAVNQALTSAQLSQLGFASDMAMSGEEALDYLQARAPRLVLMDWHMVGLSGLETTTKVRENEARTGRPRVPIIGLTAQAMAGDRERCIEAGMDGFLSKPVPLADLRSELDRWM